MATYKKNNEFCSDLGKADDTSTSSQNQTRRKRQVQISEATAIVESDENVINQPTALVIFQDVDRYACICMICN